MLTTLEGTYRNGHIELNEAPVELQGEIPVIVTFLAGGEIDLSARGISPAQATQLRASLAPFEDWNEPEMDSYNDYDAAHSQL